MSLDYVKKAHRRRRSVKRSTTYASDNAWLRVPLHGNVFINRGPTEISLDASWKSPPFQTPQSRVVNRRRFDELLTPAINEGLLEGQAAANPYARHRPGPAVQLPKLPIYPSPRPHDQLPPMLDNSCSPRTLDGWRFVSELQNARGDRRTFLDPLPNIPPSFSLNGSSTSSSLIPVPGRSRRSK